MHIELPCPRICDTNSCNMAKRDREEAAEAEADPDHASPGKRPRNGQPPAAGAGGNDAAKQQLPPAAEEEEEEDDMAGYLPRSTSRAVLKKGQECPYLDTISRQVGNCSAW